MRVYISADIEGVSGVVNNSHISVSGNNYGRARKLMTDEVNVAINTVLDFGTSEVYVNDSHGPMTNILIEELNHRANLISGYPKPMSMMEGINSEFDAAIFIGYHARMNTSGVLSHSFDGRVISNITVNDQEVGEFGLNAYLAGYYNVPVIAVSGDNVLEKEVKTLNNSIETIVVKTARSRYGASCLTPHVVHEILEEKIKKALKNKEKIKPCKINGPIDMEVTFLNSGMAEVASIMPNTKLIEPNKVYYRAGNMLEAYKVRMVLTSLANEA